MKGWILCQKDVAVEDYLEMMLSYGSLFYFYYSSGIKADVDAGLELAQQNANKEMDSLL